MKLNFNKYGVRWKKQRSRDLYRMNHSYAELDEFGNPKNKCIRMGTVYRLLGVVKRSGTFQVEFVKSQRAFHVCLSNGKFTRYDRHNRSDRWADHKGEYATFVGKFTVDEFHEWVQKSFGHYYQYMMYIDNDLRI